MSVDKMSADKMSVDKMSVDKMSADKMSVDKMSVDKMSADDISTDKMTRCLSESSLTIFVEFLIENTKNFFHAIEEKLTNELRKRQVKLM